MLLLLLSSIALAAAPSATLSWRKGTALLDLQAPSGEHVDPASPGSLDLSLGGETFTWSGSGATLARGLRLPAVEGPVEGRLRVSLCEDAGTLCRVVEVGLRGELAGRKGAQVLVVSEGEPEPGPQPASDFAADPDTAVAEALALAGANGGLVLLDFGAAWCPPCNLLGAEVLHDPADAELLAGFVVVAVDADRRDSWALKDRYRVGGYPTVVAVDPTGRELARVVGYAGEADFKGWLEAVGQGLDLGVMLAEPQPPAIAAGLAWELARQGQKDEARRQLLVALQDPGLLDRIELRRARLMLLDPVLEDTVEEDLAWLAAHETSPQAALVWIWAVLDQAGAQAGALQGLLLGLLQQASPVQGADLLYAAAELEPDESAARGLFAAGAALLRQGLSGDPERDRGHQTFLAELLARAGRLDDAVAVLQAARQRWPGDFTFHYALAGQLHEGGRSEQALEPARAALEHSYGDNGLRAARRLAEVLHATGATDEARRLVARTLEQAERPAEGLDVRTPRYLQALEELAEELGE